MTDSSVAVQCLTDSSSIPLMSLSECYEIEQSQQGGCMVTLLPPVWNRAETAIFLRFLCWALYINQGEMLALSIWHFLGAVFLHFFSLTTFYWYFKVSWLIPKTFLGGRCMDFIRRNFQDFVDIFVWSDCRLLFWRRWVQGGRRKLPWRRKLRTLPFLLTHLHCQILGMNAQKRKKKGKKLMKWSQ